MDNSFTGDHGIATVDSINYFIIIVSILLYGIRLFQLAYNLAPDAPFRIQTRILVILIFAMFIIFLLRFLWNFLYTIRQNPLIESLNDIFDESAQNNNKWFAFPFCFPLLPSLLPFQL